MNRILFLFHSTYGDSFFKAFAQELAKNGNQILFANLCDLNLDELKNKIKEFSPSMLFSFNFPNISELKEYLPEKKVLFDIDTPENIIDKNYFIEEYNTNKKMYYVSIQSDYIDILKNTVPEIKDYSRCGYMPLATSFKNTKIATKRNIFFCSTNWDYDLVETLSPLDKKELVEYYEALKDNYFANKDLYFKNNKDINSFSLKWNISGIQRVNHLSVLSDLGLEIYGDRWEKLFYDLDLMRCLKYEKILDSNDCEKFYNESKISVNFSHLQAKNAFSFRVMDIMATGSCLLMEDKKDWHSLFDKYLSKETIDSVIYKDRYDMRQKAKRLLADENLRLKCVEELNYAIEQNGRYEHRLETLENIINTKIRNLSSDGQIIEFKIKNVKNEQIQQKKKLNFKNKIRYKIWRHYDKILRKKGLI